MFVNILIQFLFWHFICQVEIRFYIRSVKYNLSFPHQFSSFNFLTYSSGICTSNTLKSQINCDFKTLYLISLQISSCLFREMTKNYYAVFCLKLLSCPNKSLINRTFCQSYKKLQKLSYIFSSGMSNKNRNKYILLTSALSSSH